MGHEESLDEVESSPTAVLRDRGRPTRRRTPGRNTLGVIVAVKKGDYPLLCNAKKNERGQAKQDNQTKSHYPEPCKLWTLHAEGDDRNQGQYGWRDVD